MGRGRVRECATLRRLTALAVAAWLGGVGQALAANDAMLKLLQVLRDRGSISAQEYEDIRKVAEASDVADVAETPAEVGKRLGTVEQRLAEQDKAVAGIKTSTEGAVPPLVSKALSGKWYEKIGLRGYTQVRYADVLTEEVPPLEVPADRSVNEAESIVIRRGRFIFSGDPAEHLSLYAQMDFNGSTGAPDFSVQMRDLYGDVWLDSKKLWRVRIGQSKVPFGWVNLQSSQNRAAFERPDALNVAVEGERDLGAYLMWNTAAAKQRFRDLVGLGLKGSGDYGAVAFGVYSGQGLNRSDQNGEVHVVGRASYPFKLASGQYVELGVQGYRGRFVSPVQAITLGGASVTPTQDEKGALDERVAVSAVWYPQPLGIEAEWTFGRGPTLSDDFRRIDADSLQGGYLQVNYRTQGRKGTWVPFTRWNFYDGSRKFARNAPRMHVNEVDFGLEFARWAELELTAMVSRTFSRTRTGLFPYTETRGATRLGLQAQINY